MALITVVHFSPGFNVLLLFFYFYPTSLSTYFPYPTFSSFFFSLLKQSCCIAQTGLQLMMILLVQPSEF